ncbi:MAG TPA: type II CAAX endopeptidase family protein [Opitutaceae bacterium]|nr:type II CAAX endopeptidase family protein [Opitutaceae bacterium]
MEAAPIPLLAAAASFVILAAGLALLGRGLFVAERRKKWFETNALAHWDIAAPEVAILLCLMVIDGFFLQLATQLVLSKVAPEAAVTPGTPMTGLQVLASGLSFGLGTLLGWILFGRIRRGWQPEVGGPPRNVAVPAYRLPWTKVLVAGGTAVLVALPLVLAASLVWSLLIRLLKLPQEPQDLVAIFARTDSPWVFAGLVVTVTVVAPLSEELMFRGVLYRFLRQRFGRAVALTASSLLFAAIHFNWSSFASLAALAAVLALAYEKTGDLRVPVVAHGLFNLNTTIFILAGQGQA